MLHLKYKKDEYVKKTLLAAVAVLTMVTGVQAAGETAYSFTAGNHMICFPTASQSVGKEWRKLAPTEKGNFDAKLTNNAKTISFLDYTFKYDSANKGTSIYLNGKGDKLGISNEEMSTNYKDKSQLYVDFMIVFKDDSAIAGYCAVKK